MLWNDENAVGKRLNFDGRSAEVVGVVRDIKGRYLLQPPDPMLYLPLFQSYHPNVILHVRTIVPPHFSRRDPATAALRTRPAPARLCRHPVDEEPAVRNQSDGSADAGRRAGGVAARRTDGELGARPSRRARGSEDRAPQRIGADRLPRDISCSGAAGTWPSAASC